MVTKHEILRKQRSRTMQARAQDAVRTSKEVSKRTDKKAVEKWMKHPGRIDLRAVDTKGRGKGWYEEKNPLTEKAPIHQEVALKKRVYETGSVYQPQHKIVPGLVNEINKIEDKIEVLEEKKEAIKEVIKEENEKDDNVDLENIDTKKK